MTRQVVYTAVIGGYESLGAQPAARGSAADFVCFTDDPDLGNDDWTMVLVTPPFPLDPSRSQRFFKILGHALLEQYDEALYIDNSVELSVDPALFLHEWLEDRDAAFIEHGFRDRVIDEFDEVLEVGLDDPSRVHEQLLHYSLVHPHTLEERPSWNGMFAYRPSPVVREAMTVWYRHVLRYSRRDQLSWNATMGVSTLRIRRITLDNHRSELHSWPVMRGRGSRGNRMQALARPLVGELARREREVKRLEATAAEAERRLDEVTLRLRDTETELHETRRTLSWRMTAPLRAARRLRR